MLLNFALLLLCWPTVHGDTGEVLREFVAELKALQDTPPVCTPAIYGEGWNGHALCNHNSITSRECFYINYGIAADWSFDTAVTSKLNCSGVALDPTVNLPVEIVPGVYFLKLGANMLTPSPFPTAPVPRFRQWVGHNRVFALKMDCEGCEYALAPDVDAIDPTFWSHIDQLNIELHMHVNFLNSEQQLANLARLLEQLKEARLHLVHTDGYGCGMAPNCAAVLSVAGYNCSQDCSSFLFAKRIVT